MKFENFITQYLETSRILFKKENSKEKVFKMLKEGYNLSFSYFRCLLELKVNLIVTYSMNRVCETGKYGDQLFIIYDHYLGQTFNLLNNIYYSSHNPKDIYIYINKVISEYFYIKWRPDISKLYNENYLNLFKKWKGYTFKTAKDEDRKKQILSIPIQEAFVIAHELYHMFIEVTELDWNIAIGIEDSEDEEDCNELETEGMVIQWNVPMELLDLGETGSMRIMAVATDGEGRDYDSTPEIIISKARAILNIN